MRECLAANAGFRRYVLRELRRRGPLRSRDLEDRAQVPWRTGGWNDGKNVGRLLDALWFGGEIAIVGRTGSQRMWDLAERLRELGITHRRGGYRDPESQAFIESWFGKLKEREVWRNEYETLTQAVDAVTRYIEAYHHRPHSLLAYRTPAEVATTWRTITGPKKPG